MSNRQNRYIRNLRKLFGKGEVDRHETRNFTYRKGDMNLSFNLDLSDETKASIDLMNFMKLLKEALVDLEFISHELNKADDKPDGSSPTIPL